VHKLLVRQIDKHLGGSRDTTPGMAAFLKAVDAAYQQADDDRALLERSMDIASREMIARYNQLQQALEHSRKAEEQLVHQALHDALTDLPNRVLFLDRVEHALSRSRRYPKTVAVLYVDLDDFKRVNDSFGHAAGDELLIAVATRLRPLLRRSDTCARLGGDEFAIVLEDAESTESAQTVAERILAVLRAPFPLGGRDVFVGASIGIAAAEESLSAGDLVRNADMAMYVAKTSGKRRVTVFEPTMYSALVRRAELEQELRGAIARSEFALHYQPIVQLESRVVTGMEALIRWEHPNRGRISPLEFIPIAEQSGMIVDLGRWVLHEACRECVRWGLAHDSLSDIGVTVNISGREIREPGFVAGVREALHATGLIPSRLTLEMTENVFVGHESATIDHMIALRKLGVRIAIDDFGTGYSSLSYLQQFPVDILKIDKSFVDRITMGDEESTLSRAVLALGSALGIRTVAEGIETDAQYECLRELGCELGQGYFIARPLEAERAAKFLMHDSSSPKLLVPGM